MKSLIWKEARQQLVWLFVALAVSTQLWFGMGRVWSQLVRSPNETGLWGIAIPLLYAFALAQLQFGRDGDSRHFGLLVHRKQGARGYFASKVIVGLAALACVLILPITIWALAMSQFDPDAALIRWERIPQTCLLCAPTLLAYAMGVLSTQLRRGALLRGVVAIAGGVGAFLVALPLVWVMGRIPYYSWVAADLILAAGVLWLARALLLNGRDRDLPLRDRQLCGFAAIAFLVLLPLGAFLRGSAESAALSVIVEAKPPILVDPATDEIFPAFPTEGGWRKREAGGQVITQRWTNSFTLGDGHELELVHHAGSSIAEGVDWARAWWAQVARNRTLSDPAWRDVIGARVAAVPANGERKADPSEHWRVQLELGAEDGLLQVEVSRVADRQPPLRVLVSRPDGKFSAEAGFLESPSHSPLVLDRADGTLWRIGLEENGARATALELPQGDRVTAIEPLFQHRAALLGRFLMATECMLVGRTGKYALLDGQIAAFTETSRPKDSVTADEALALARYAVTSSWPDAFTEELRVERLADHQTLFQCSTGLETAAARRAAFIYGGLEFLRAPASVLGERLFGWTPDAGVAMAPLATQRQLFTDGRHPLLFALLMLAGAFQLWLGWRWLVRGGAGPLARVVCMLLILVGGVTALILTRLLLPRGLGARRANEAVSWTGASPRPLHASSTRS